MIRNKQQFVELLNKQPVDKVDPGNVHQIATTICSAFEKYDLGVEMEGANIGPQATEYIMYCHVDDVDIRDTISLIKEYLEKEFMKKIQIAIMSEKQAHYLKIKIPKDSLRILVNIPNEHRITCGLRKVLESDDWKTAIENSPLAFVAGINLNGQNVIKDLGAIKTMLLTGDTRSGKTMFLHSMLTSLMYHNSSDDLKFIIMDATGVNYLEYKDNPYLAKPIISSNDEILECLKWVNEEQDRRYSLMIEKKVKTISEYNKHCEEHEKLPNLVVIIDEIAYMMHDRKLSKEFEANIVRISQRIRSSGIYLILTTQQTSVEVVTGLIKCNSNARVAFTMHSVGQSLIALERSGAESLTGFGDMLFLDSASFGYAERIQGAYLSDDEIVKVSNFLRK